MKEEVGGWGEGGEMVEWEVLEATELLSLWSGGAAGVVCGAAGCI